MTSNEAHFLPELPTPSLIEAWLNGWLCGTPLRALLDMSGIEVSVTSCLQLEDVLRWTKTWEFRRASERQALQEQPALVDGRELGEDDVALRAAELGLMNGPSPDGDFSMVVVFGGTVAACRNRLSLAKSLAESLEIPSLVMLTAHRPLSSEEMTVAVNHWGVGVSSEDEAAALAAREAFGLGELASRDGEFPDDEPSSGERRFTGWWTERWDSAPAISVVSAPSGDPSRRANTEDQLTFLVERHWISRSSRVLCVTTEHYVPYQHLVALRILGLEAGSRVVTTGTRWNPSGFRARSYLQEIRAAIVECDRLLKAIASRR